jgi:hypothetical protein
MAKNKTSVSVVEWRSCGKDLRDTLVNFYICKISSCAMDECSYVVNAAGYTDVLTNFLLNIDVFSSGRD